MLRIFQQLIAAFFERMAQNSFAAANVWLEGSVSAMQIPSEVLQEELRQLFTVPDGAERLSALFANFASSPQTSDFFEWFLKFCTERLQPSLWADQTLLLSLLTSGVHEVGLDVVEYLRRATNAQPELAEDPVVFKAALQVCISSVNAFNENFLMLPASRETLIEACRGEPMTPEDPDSDDPDSVDEEDDDRWAGRSWPLDTFPGGFLRSLPSTYCDKGFLLKAACHVDDAGVSFKVLPKQLKADRAVATAFAKRQVGILECLPDSLMQDRRLLRKGLAVEPHAIEALPKECWRDERLVDLVATKWGATFFISDVGTMHSSRKELVLKLAAQDFNTLFFVPRFYGRDAQVVEAALTSEYARWAASKERKEARHASRLLQMVWEEVVADVLKTNVTFLQKLLPANGALFRLCSIGQRGDPLLVFAAVSQDAAALKAVDESFWNSRKRRRINSDSKCKEGEDVDNVARKLLSINSESWLYLPQDVKQRLKLEAFECCVCYQLPKKEIRQCLEGGHLICQDCVEKVLKEAAYMVPRCPVCRCYVWNEDDIFSYGARNRFAETELRARLREQA